MAEIIPRWEWRSFGRHFGGADTRLTQRSTASQPHDSDEVYFLAPDGENVKVRDGLMDIKVLREVNPDGLEQWFPILKVPFPLDATQVATVYESLRAPVPNPLPESTTLDDLIRQFSAPGSTVRVVQVHKQRVRYPIGGCLAEISEDTANGIPTRTMAVEAEDPAAVIRVVRELGLGNYTNTSYPHGLLALVEGAPERYAVIDIGTNSVKFHIGERIEGSSWRTLVDRAEIPRLGEGLVPGGPINPVALERTIAVVADMIAEAKRNNVRAIVAVATAALRIASNGREAGAEALARTGLVIEVLSGEEEARLAFLAARVGLGLDHGTLIVFDTGGGSSQFTFGHDDVVDERFSLHVGAVRYTERFGLDRAVSPEVLAEAMAAIAGDLARIDGHPVPELLVGMGGTITNMTAIMHRLASYDPDVVQGSVLDRAEIERQIELFRTRDADARRSIVGIQPKRAEVILAGACIVLTIIDKFGKDHFTVSDRGLRHGVLAEHGGT